MALFKFRKGSDEPVAAGASQPETVEVLRRRARHRLIGAVVLVLVGVAGFPLLFDTQPRPIPVDIPIEIPDRNKVKPLPAPVQPAASAVTSAPAQRPSAAAPTVAPAAPPAAASPSPAAAPAVAPRSPVSAPVVVASATGARPAPAASPRAESKPEPKPEPRPEARPEPKPQPKPEAAPASKAEARPPARVDDGAKAQALLEGRPVPVAPAAALATASAATPAAVTAEGRFIVQVGAFADAGKARETRLKVERAGLKTYTHVAETKEGRRIRVRVGPFATRAEADKAAQKIKGLDLPAAILTL